MEGILDGIIHPLVFLVAILSLILLFKVWRNQKWQNKPMKNFPFIYKGKKLWYSRAVAVGHLVFCKDTEHTWHILANRRGSGTPDFQGKWNMNHGYVDFDESAEQAAQRETYEETGVFIPNSMIHLSFVDSDPHSNNQNITLYYSTVIEDKTIDEYVLSSIHCEKNEVDNIKWIPLSNLLDNEWAFDDLRIIQAEFEKINRN